MESNPVFHAERAGPGRTQPHQIQCVNKNTLSDACHIFTFHPRFPPLYADRLGRPRLLTKPNGGKTMRLQFVLMPFFFLMFLPVSIALRDEPAFADLPLYFVENQGQVQGDAAYYVPGADRTLYFNAEGVTFDLFKRDGKKTERWVTKLDFVGADPDVRPQGEDKQEAVFSFFKGKSWITGVPAYGRLVYEDLWPGIDLVYSGTVSRVKYALIVKPGADPETIRLAYRGVTELRVQASGALKVTTPTGVFEDGAPRAYQRIGGQQKKIDMCYELLHEAGEAQWTYGFHLGNYDRAKPLMLDPVLNVCCGYIGGVGDDEGRGIAVDKAGNSYVTGRTMSTETTFPVNVGPGLLHSNYGPDAFVAKVNAQGTALIYCGYIGGSGGYFSEGAHDIDVDAQGNAYIIGATSSDQATFPVKKGPDLTYNGGDCDAFVAKVNAQGTDLEYCGYIGGDSWDDGTAIAVDGDGNACVTGITSSDSATFPDYLGPDVTYNGGQFDAFVARVDASGQSLHYCGYIGGSDSDSGLGIAVDDDRCAYVVGTATSDELSFPVVLGPDLTYNGGNQDAFIAKVHNKGLSLEYCGYIGGEGSDQGWDVVVGGTNAAYVTGYTQSSETTFPVKVGPDVTYNGGTDAFVAMVTPQGTALSFCGYIGGTGYERATGIALYSSGHVYVTGHTASTEASFPVRIGPDLTYNGGDSDAFVARIGSNIHPLELCGYIGGAASEESWDIAVDIDDKAYMTGKTTSTEASFPVAVGPDLTQNGAADAFVAKIEVTPGTWYVDDDNTGGPWEGTSQHPFQFIMDAVDIALDHDTVLVRPGTYQENIDYSSKEIALRSTDGPAFTTIDGGTPTNPFQGSVVKLTGGGPETVLEGFTLTNGYGSKIGADPFYKGGAIICLNSSALIRNNVLVKNSVSPGHGAGIYSAYGSPTIEGNVITENSAGGTPGCGGALYIYMDATASDPLHVENNDLSWNDAADNGGGIFLEGEAGNPLWPDLVVIANNTISGNDAQKHGGGIDCYNHASPTIRGNDISMNRAMLGGGGLMLSYHAHPGIDANFITRNDGDWGGSGAWGGGIRCDTFSSPIITNNMIAENTAGKGGGIHCLVGSNPEIINNTLSGNSASGLGLTNGCDVTVMNTILWNNGAVSGKEIVLENSCSLSIGYSDVEGGQASVFLDLSSTLDWGAGMIDADPLFLDPSSLDLHLTASSPCIEAGANSVFVNPLPLEDFDGDPRIFAGNGKGMPIAGTTPSDPDVDMGADEYCLFKRQKYLLK
jgi:parallel beta-helix repeat protein